jgi:site-specific DNA-methyltransferase (adenine-specific)
VKCDIAPSRFEPDLEGDAAQRRDALNLLCALSAGCAPLAFFDPQHRGVLDRLKFGNEGSRQRGRTRLPSMSDEYIDAWCREIARAWGISCALDGHVWPMRGPPSPRQQDRQAGRPHRLGFVAYMHEQAVAPARRLSACLTEAPVTARTWRDHAIPSRWPEKVDQAVHPHIKPIGLISRLIAAVTEPGDLIIDPAAGSFVVMKAAKQLDRHFVGCDVLGGDWRGTGPSRRSRRQQSLSW